MLFPMFEKNQNTNYAFEYDSVHSMNYIIYIIATA